MNGSRWWRTWRFSVALLVAGSIVLLIVGTIWYFPSPRQGDLSVPAGAPPVSVVRIQGYDLILSYTVPPGGNSSYLHAPECGNCPLNVTPGSTWVAALGFRNGDAARSHNITGILLNSPFILSGSTPVLPVSIGAGASIAITISVDAPGTPGYYFLTGTIETD